MIYADRAISEYPKVGPLNVSAPVTPNFASVQFPPLSFLIQGSSGARSLLVVTLLRGGAPDPANVVFPGISKDATSNLFVPYFCMERTNSTPTAVDAVKLQSVLEVLNCLWNTLLLYTEL